MNLETGKFKAEDLIMMYRPPFLASVMPGNHVMLASGGPDMIVAYSEGDTVHTSRLHGGELIHEEWDIHTLTCYGAK